MASLCYFSQRKASGREKSMKYRSVGRTHRIAVLLMALFFLTCIQKVFAYAVITLNSGEIVIGRVVDNTDTNISIVVGNYDNTKFSTKVIAKSDIKTFEKEPTEQKFVDLSGEWTFSTGYVGGRISLVQSNNYLSGTENYITDDMHSGKCMVDGRVDYPKVFLISRSETGSSPPDEYVIRWKDGKHCFLKSKNPAFAADLYRASD
jgi:hypothetical protein